MPLSVGVVAEIKGRLPVADVVGETVQLKKAGTTLKGLCPFHGEKTPSFVVTPARDTWHCFGCGKHGDIFTFVMERDGAHVPRGARAARRPGGRGARRADQARGRPQRAPPRRDGGGDRLLPRGPAEVEARRARARVPARPRLHRRDDREAPARLGARRLGHARPPARRASARCPRRELIEVGLASPRQRGGGVYDRFRERVIFPIRDQNGHAVGLGGRILGKEGDGEDGRRGPKYLNSPATPLFDKSRTLYLIDRAKSAIRKAGQAVIVEGYTDALMAHQAGFDNVVASLGTALTPRQVALLTRYAKRIALAYDVDAAGEKAGTFGATALEELIRQLAADDSGVELDDVRVVRLPEGKDPDEVVRETPTTGARASARAPHRRPPDRRPRPGPRPADAGRPGAFVDAVLPIIRNLPNPGAPRRLPPARPPGVRGGGADAARGVAPPASADAAPAATAGRFSAARSSPPRTRCPSTTSCAASRRTEQELLRLVLLVPETHDRSSTASGPTGCRARSRASCTGPWSRASATSTASGRRSPDVDPRRARREAAPSGRPSRAPAPTRASSPTARSPTSWSA